MKNIKRILTLFLIFALLFISGSAFAGEPRTASAASGSRKIVVKPASDFKIKVPGSWSGHYVMKKSKKIKHGSYVAFYSKKCYKETGEGWLFSIMRYKDDSYEDMPSYELTGKWNGYNYVVVYPTDVQTTGVTKKAAKEYADLTAAVEKTAHSVYPVKKSRKGRRVYRASDFSLYFPSDWRKDYTVKKTKRKKKDWQVAFYAKKCHKQTGEGFLFAIERYTDESYMEMPSYKLVGMWNGISYVAIFPTDVQYFGATKAAVNQYLRCEKKTEKVAGSIRP